MRKILLLAPALAAASLLGACSTTDGTSTKTNSSSDMAAPPADANTAPAPMADPATAPVPATPPTTAPDPTTGTSNGTGTTTTTTPPPPPPPGN